MQKGHKPFLYAKGGYQDDELAGSLIALTRIRLRLSQTQSANPHFFMYVSSFPPRKAFAGAHPPMPHAV
jgi:hypothetical protein